MPEGEECGLGSLVCMHLHLHDDSDNHVTIQLVCGWCGTPCFNVRVHGHNIVVCCKRKQRKFLGLATAVALTTVLRNACSWCPT